MTKYEQARHNIREQLKPRLNKLGSITTGEAHKICGDQYTYGTFCAHFKVIMDSLVREERADFIRNGFWFIHKQIKTAATGSGL